MRLGIISPFGAFFEIFWRGNNSDFKECPKRLAYVLGVIGEGRVDEKK